MTTKFQIIGITLESKVSAQYVGHEMQTFLTFFGESKSYFAQ